MSSRNKKLKNKTKPAKEDSIADKEVEKKKLMKELKTLKKELKTLREDEQNLKELAMIDKQKVEKQVHPNEHKMFEYYGIVCETKDDQSRKFTFPMLNEDGSTTEYFIQLSNNDEQRGLMKFFLPMSIDLHEILAETPINNAKKFPDMLLQLRHNILCYQNRKRQLTELIKRLKTLKNCEVVYRNDGITQIFIRFYSIENHTTEKTLNFDISVNYLPDERLPRQFSITPSSVTDDDFDDQTLILLKKNFVKPFKKVELKYAIENLVEADTSPLVWTSTTKPFNENFDESLSENEEDSMDEFLKSLKNKTSVKDVKKQTKKKSETKTTKDENVKMKKDKKGTTKKISEMLANRNEDEQQTELTMESPTKENETLTKSESVTVIDENVTTKKNQKKLKTRQAEVQKSQSEEEPPAEISLKTPVKKKKTVNQNLNETTIDEKQITKKSRKVKKAKQAELKESQSEDEQPAETAFKSPVKKKKTANQNLNKKTIHEKETTKKSEKKKKAKEAEVVESQSVESQSENEQPAETKLKSPAKKKRAANQSLNRSLTKKMKIDSKQTTLNFESKVDDAKIQSKIPVMKKKLPTIVSMQNFSSSTPLVSKKALRSEKKHFIDISNISEIGKD